MAEYRYYLIPDAMTRAFTEQFVKQTPTEFFDNIADLKQRYHQLREMPYNNEHTWNERVRFPYARLVVGIDRQNPDGAVAIIQVRNGINYLCDDYRGPYADRSDTRIPQMAEKLVEVIGVDRVRPHTYTQRDGYTWVQVEKDMHITEWLYAHELCSSLQFTRFLNRDGRELFQVRDGQRVIETNADGTKRLRAVKNIDVTHAYVGHYGCHVQQYADANFKSGCYVTPEHPQPGDNLDKLQIYQITADTDYRFMRYSYAKNRMVKTAIETANTTDASAGLAEAFGSMEYKSINGTYVFAEDHTAIADPEHLVISAAQVRNGEYLVVWPENFAYAEYQP